MSSYASSGFPESVLLDWTRELYLWWGVYNLELLGGALSRPEIRLSESTTELGSWRFDCRRIDIAVDHVASSPWLEVMETLRHEMAHQFAHEVLGAQHEPPHGPAFQRACSKLRVENPDVAADVEGGSERARVLDTVRKLLALGTSPNRNEAESAVRKARALLVQHSLDPAQLESRRSYRVRQLGPVKARHQSFEYSLATVLNEFFFVEVIWSTGFDARALRRGTVLHVYGTEANLEMAAYVFDYLTQTVESLWQEYRAQRGLPGNRDRMRFYDGVLHGVREKLRQQDESLVREQGLVLKRDAELGRFYRYHNPDVQIIYGSGKAITEAYREGKRAGRDVTIQRPITSEQAGGGLLNG